MPGTSTKNDKKAFVVTPCFVKGKPVKFGETVTGADAAYLISCNIAVDANDAEAVDRAKAKQAAKVEQASITPKKKVSGHSKSAKGGGA